MTARPKDIGTAAETAVVRYLRGAGWPHAERRALRGTQDAGDITGTPGICWEVKGGAAAKSASDNQIAEWMRQAEKERAAAAANHGILVVQRAGYGPARAESWWACLDIQDVAELTSGGMPFEADSFTVRMSLFDACALLRHAGYGSEVSDG